MNDKIDYKSTYNIKNFNLDVLKTAIGDYFEGKYAQRDIPYHLQLQYELNSVRNKIMYDNTYYTPTFEELKEGDELEMQSSWGWFKGTWPQILWQETHCNMAAYRAKNDTVEFRFNNATLRKSK